MFRRFDPDAWKFRVMSHDLSQEVGLINAAGT